MSKAFPDNLTYETEDVTNSFSSYLAIISIDGSQMMAALANYDGDDLELKMYELSETLEDNAEVDEIHRTMLMDDSDFK